MIGLRCYASMSLENASISPKGNKKDHDMGLRLFRNHPMLRLTLALGFWGGFAGVLVDLDHWFNTTGFKGWGLKGRPLHLPLAILAGCVGIYSIARLGRWSVVVVLIKALIFLLIIAVLIGLELLWAMYMWNV